MTDEQAGGGAPETTTPEVKTDPFGISHNADGTPAEAPRETPEEKKEKGGDEIEKHPTVVELRTKLDEYSKNLSGQNAVIDGLKSTIAKLEAGIGGKKDGEGDKKDEGEALFKEIKFSKDLTQDQRDDMTDAEIAQMDRLANMETAMNTMFGAIKQGQTKQEAEKVEDLNSTVNAQALTMAEEALKANPALATDANELRNKIIVEFNEFNNADIKADQIPARLKKALNNVPNYVAPKEEKAPDGKGGAVKKKGDTKGGSFGVDSVVAQVQRENNGNYDL